jgi:hypothetical protein
MITQAQIPTTTLTASHRTVQELFEDLLNWVVGQ